MNRGWTVESNADWVTITKVACNTDANGVTIAENAASATVPATGLIYKVYYNIAANEATSAREATLTVTADGQTIGSVTVKQAAYVPPTGTTTTVAKWSWTGLYKDNTDNPTLASMSQAWIDGGVVNSDVVAGGEFSITANADATFSTGTKTQKKDRLRATKLTLGDYFEFKVTGLSLKKDDIIRLKNAGFGTTSIVNGVTKWIVEYSFNGQTWTTDKELELTGANKPFSIEMEATATEAASEFYVRVRANEEIKGTGASMLMMMINGDANVADINTYYTDEWAFIYFETETY